MKKRILALLLAALLLCGLSIPAQAGETHAFAPILQARAAARGADGAPVLSAPAPTPTAQSPPEAEEDGEYTAAEDIAIYLLLYGHLPSNFITKDEARDLGWNAREGNLWDVAPGKSIGGDLFGNREGLLPRARGRVYYECDVDYAGGYRGEKRLIYSNDGLIYYTEDHYASFTCLSE